MNDVFCRDNVTTGRSVTAGPPGVVTQKLCDLNNGMAIVVGQVTVTPAPTTQFGFDSTNGRVVAFTTTVNPDDTVSQTYTYQDDGTPMSDNSNFTPSSTSVETIIDDDHVFSTITDPADANYGLCIELEKRTVVTDGVVGASTFHLFRDVAAITGTAGDDVTAVVAAAPWSGVSTDERSVIFPNANLTVTGATPLALPAVPVHAGYVRAEISNGSGVIYTTDGTAPTTTPLNGQPVGFGGEAVLREDEIAAALFLPIDATGQFDAAETTDLSFEVRNKAFA